MTDFEGIEASQHPKQANPRRHDHELWVQARRAEILRQNRRDARIKALIFICVCGFLLATVLAFADVIDAGWPL